MLIENKWYRMIFRDGKWACEEVTAEECERDFSYCKRHEMPLTFTIRQFQSGVSFLLYCPGMTQRNITRQADYMASTPGR